MPSGVTSSGRVARSMRLRFKGAAIRFALYFTPPAGDPLTISAARWLGRDAFGHDVPDRGEAGGFSAAEIDARTAAARRYGMHATLKAPFHLAEGRKAIELEAALGAWAADAAPAAIEELTLARLGGFFALVPRVQDDALIQLAAAIVRDLEPFRAPLTDSEIARRKPDGLSPAERENLFHWGYPHVMDEFRFHMTLTDRIENGEAARMQDHLETRFAPFLRKPLPVDHVALFVEPEAGGPFVVQRLFPLGRPAA